MTHNADNPLHGSFGDKHDLQPATSRSIRTMLVRLQPAGDLIHCGTIHDLAPARLQPVVVQTGEGVWIADWLSEIHPDQTSAENPPELAGEVLRLASEEDQQSSIAAEGLALRLHDEATAVLANTSLPIVLVATEVDLEHRFAKLRFLGKPHEALGPLADQIARRIDLQRVQWVSLQDPLGAPGDNASGAPSGQLQALPDRQEKEFWDRWDTVTSPGPLLDHALGKSFRVAAGNRGWYQQKRRAANPAGRHIPAGRSWMVRIRTAAGGILASQLVQLLKWAEEYGDGTLRLTMRQSIQLHGIAGQSSDELMQKFGDHLLSTLGSCGNSVRNLTCCPLPPSDREGFRAAEQAVRDLAIGLGNDFLPRGSAFEYRFSEQRSTPVSASPKPPPATESISQLPHKFKIGIASDHHDCADVLSNDLGIVVRTASFHSDRFQTGAPSVPLVDLYVGGSTSYRADDNRSSPQLALWLGTIPLEKASQATEMLLGMFARRSLDASRHFQRWKYVVQRTGIPILVDQFRQQAGDQIDLVRESPPALPRPGRHPAEVRASNGQTWRRWHFPCGRIYQHDLPTLQRWATESAPIRVGTDHDLIVRSRMTDGAMPLPPIADRACPAMPTCPLAVAPAETEWKEWSTAVQRMAEEAAIGPLPFAISGCSNGCSRPLTTVLGVIAETPKRRAVFLGGTPTRLGTRVGQVNSPAELVQLIRPWLLRFHHERLDDEDFAVWFWRIGLK
ncbi:Sulfite reductase [NADPH] hemoprotein beta-component [Roseimaritima multifibrata]|uniref:Sulfite reductase [NADPH] hemoprotein beta-component n=1 Tax=Roseimaritima multifibrata TaxID=1930274 RepID=A0A517MJI1_9BACT|nr:hypothetical protein [Roseimaritima multifibrata]QDS95056.1 Sulfite reductase [NADPH] hemoprotein beta-component [Roseimaritima multifibrata]